MHKQSKVMTSLLFAATLGFVVALPPALAHFDLSFKSKLQREAAQLQGSANEVAKTAGEVKQTAAKVEQIAAKTKASAAMVQGVAVMASKGLGILAGKTACGTEEHAEFVVQHLLEKALQEQGVKVVDEDGPSVCGFKIYIGIDDDDDDDDGILDAEDTDDFGDADDIIDDDDEDTVDNDDLPDNLEIEIDIDKLVPKLSEGLPDTEESKGIFILLVSDNPDQVVIFRLHADTFAKEETCSQNSNSPIANIFAAMATASTRVMSFPKPPAKPLSPQATWNLSKDFQTHWQQEVVKRLASQKGR